MSVTGRRLIIWGIILVALAAGIGYSFRPQPVPVDLATARKALLRVTIDDEGTTRVRNVYTLHAPVSGHLLRITADPGDPVRDNQTVLARIEPAPPAMLDLRTHAERQAAVQAAEAAQALARADVQRAEASLTFATAERNRARKLISSHAISQRDLDEAERAFGAAKAELASSRASLEMRTHELAVARSRLLPRGADARQDAAREDVNVTAPVSGVVLRVIRRSAGIIEAGAPLVDIGDPHDLEIVADPISEDAVRMHPGQKALITGWGGPDLNAVVRRIDPVGQTKVSALGIEEQRVNVVLDLTDPPSAWRRLGDDYRVDVRVILFQGNVLQVPAGALFRDGDSWAVYVDDHGTARLRQVKIGQRNSFDAEIRSGLAADQRVVLYPNDRIRNGVAISPQ